MDKCKVLLSAQAAKQRCQHWHKMFCQQQRKASDWRDAARLLTYTLKNRDAEIAILTAEVARLTAFAEAIEEECIVAFVDPASTPRDTLRKLIDWHVMVALDPQVSAQARAMVERAEAAERELAALRERVREYCSMRMSPDDRTSRGELLSIAFESMRRMAETQKPGVCVGCVDYTSLDCPGYAAERELAALRAAVRWLTSTTPPVIEADEHMIACGSGWAEMPPEHAEALRKATT